MEGQTSSWNAYYHQPASRPPSVTKILYDLESRQLTNPIFVCLHCATESQTQQAMAGHCRKHVRAGMAKGTVDHVKYYPDHTYVFLCNNPKPKNPQAPTQQLNQQIYHQVPEYRYNRILFPWPQLNGPQQGLINMPDMRGPTLEGSSSSPFGGVMTPNHNVVGSCTTLYALPVVDLTLRLGPNPTSTSEYRPMQGRAFPF